MPKGFHLGHIQTRHYTTEYNKLYAKTFKTLLNSQLGNYSLNTKDQRTPITLKQTKNGLRYITLEHQDNTLEIGLLTCNKSASNKLYITCPYCQTKRQHLYECKSGYACQSCLNLHYASQSETKANRLARRIRTLRIALWGHNAPDIYNLIESARWFVKPKHMRWASFEKKRDHIVKLEEKYWELSGEKLINLFNKLK